MGPLRLIIFRYNNNNINSYNINCFNKITIAIIRFLFRLRIIFLIIEKVITVVSEFILLIIFNKIIFNEITFIKTIFKFSIRNRLSISRIRKL